MKTTPLTEEDIDKMIEDDKILMEALAMK